MKHLAIVFLLFIAMSPELIAQPSFPADTVFDIPYVDGGGHKQQLDLYTPSEEGFPTLLFVHGGSLTGGDRKDKPIAQMCQTFQDLGIGCAAMSYRLAPEHTWPTMPRDVASAFAWIKQHIGARGGDPDRVFLFGHSSGCLLAAIISTDAQYLQAHGLGLDDVAGTIPLGCRLDNRVEVMTAPDDRTRAYEVMRVPASRVDEFVAREEAYDSIEAINDAVPAAHVGPDLPPTLVLIAEGERFFPPILRDAAEFVGRALSAGAEEVDLVILENRRHMSALERMVTADDPAVRLVERFVRSH